MRRSITKYGTLIPVAAVLAAYSGPAYADVVDADVVSATTGNQTSRDLGVFQPGEVRTLPLSDGVSFTLRCSGNQHVERNQTVTMKLSSASITPTGGSKSITTLLRATDSALASLPTTWPTDNTACPPDAAVLDTGNSEVTITAPTAAGTYRYDAAFAPHFTPAGQDSSDIQGSTGVSFDITVSDTNPTIGTDAANVSRVEGTALTNAGSFTGGNGPLALTLTGAGSLTPSTTTPGAWSWSHSPTGVATGNVTVTATDADGDVVRDTFTWTTTAANTAPVVSTNAGNVSGREHTEIVNNGAFMDADGNGTLTITKAEGAGAVAASTTTPGAWTWSHTPTAMGSGTVVVRATDDNGVTVEDSFTWTATDGTAPETTIDAKPAVLSNDGSPSFTFSSDEAGSTFQCSVDGGAYAACTSPKTLTGLADGAHTFAVRATDGAGNTDATPASHSWTKDTTAPETTIDAKPAVLSNDGSPSFTFSSDEAGSTFQCSVDGGAYAACTSPKTLTGLADGAHTFAVRATDGAGNTDATPASHSWTKDTTAPETTIDAKPAVLSNDGSPSFTFSSDEAGSTFQCSVDGGAYAACTSPKTLTGLADGAHTFAVRATDGAGNTDATPASHSWTKDTTAPETTIDAKPAVLSNDGSPSFTFSSDEAGSTFQCSVDGGAYAACTSPKTLTGLADGAHTFAVRATDGAGNTDATPASHSWTKDTTAPETTIDAKPAVLSNDGSPSFTFSSDEAGSTFQCSVDGGAYAACTSPKTLTGLADGAHTFAVRATDGAGNTDATPASHSWTKDTTAPETTIDAKPAVLSNDGSPSFTFSSDEAGSTFQCSVDGGAYAACTSPKTLTGLADGAHTFAVRATDGAGNTDATPASHSWTKDTVGPTGVNLVNGPAAATTYYLNKLPAAPTCDATDPSGVTCTVSGYSTALGTHVLTATATDGAGNVSTATRTYSVRANLERRGFFSPVDMGGVWNTIRGGNTVPLKFEVFDGVELTETAAIGATFTAAKVTCSTGTDDAIEVFTTAGETSLRYDSTAGQFIQNWKTPTGTGCYKVTLTTADGLSLVAYFKTLK